ARRGRAARTRSGSARVRSFRHELLRAAGASARAAGRAGSARVARTTRQRLRRVLPAPPRTGTDRSSGAAGSHRHGLPDRHRVFAPAAAAGAQPWPGTRSDSYMAHDPPRRGRIGAGGSSLRHRVCRRTQGNGLRRTPFRKGGRPAASRAHATRRVGRRPPLRRALLALAAPAAGTARIRGRVAGSGHRAGAARGGHRAAERSGRARQGAVAGGSTINRHGKLEEPRHDRAEHSEPERVTDCYKRRRESSYRAIAPAAATFRDSAPTSGIVASTSRSTASASPLRSAPSRNETRPTKSSEASGAPPWATSATRVVPCNNLLLASQAPTG